MVTALTHAKSGPTEIVGYKIEIYSICNLDKLQMRHDEPSGAWRRGDCAHPFSDKSEKHMWGNYPE